MNYISRHAESAVEKLVKMFGAILVAGPRQVGKTTMLKRITKDINYVSLDDLIVQASAREQSGTFFKDNPPPVFIDEVQKAPELFPQIKMLIDRERKKGQFYMCGSQQFQMMKGISESLSGRIGLITLLGFSMRERYNVPFTLPFLPTDAYFAERRKELVNIPYDDVWNMIHRGSMPELSENPDFDWQLPGQYAMIHRLQPACLVGNNHHQAPFAGEDIQIFERDLPGENRAGLSGQDISALPLETCETMNGMWGYKITDQDYKSTKTLIHYLVKAAGKDANLLMNIGPQPDGELPAVALERLAEVGEWMKVYGETIYGTRGGCIAPHPWGVTTQRENKLY